MTNNRNFWIVQMIALLALYGAALVLILQGQGTHRLVTLVQIILVLHVLEIPLAFYLLKARNPQPLRVIVGTLLFGLLWWIPARRGLIAVA